MELRICVSILYESAGGLVVRERVERDVAESAEAVRGQTVGGRQGDSMTGDSPVQRPIRLESNPNIGKPEGFSSELAVGGRPVPNSNTTYGLIDFLRSLLFDKDDSNLKSFPISEEDFILLKSLLVGRLYSARNKRIKSDLFKINRTNFAAVCRAHRKQFGHQRMNILKRSILPKFIRRIERMQSGLALAKPADNVYSNRIIQDFLKDPAFDREFHLLCKNREYLEGLLAENEQSFLEGFEKWRKIATAKLRRKMSPNRLWGKIHLPIFRNCLEKFVHMFDC